MADPERTRALSPEALRDLVDRSDDPHAFEQAPTRIHVRAAGRGAASEISGDAGSESRARGAATATCAAVPLDVPQRAPRRRPLAVALLAACVPALATLVMAWRWFLWPAEGGELFALSERDASSKVAVPRDEEEGARPRPIASSAGPPRRDASSGDARSGGQEGPPPPQEPAAAAEGKQPRPAARHVVPSAGSEADRRAAERAVVALAGGDLELATDLYRGLAQSTGDEVYAGIGALLERRITCGQREEGETPCVD